MPSGPWNLQEKTSTPEAGKVTSTCTLPLGGMSLSMPSAGMLRLCNVRASFSTSSVSFCPGLPRRKVGEK